MVVRHKAYKEFNVELTSNWYFASFLCRVYLVHGSFLHDASSQISSRTQYLFSAEIMQLMLGCLRTAILLI